MKRQADDPTPKIKDAAGVQKDRANMAPDPKRADEDMLDLDEVNRVAGLGSERDYVDDEHPEEEDGDISPYRTEGDPLEILTADDPLAGAATLGGKYSGGGRDR